MLLTQKNLLKTHWKFAAKELYNGFVISRTVEAAKRFIPSLTVDDFVRFVNNVMYNCNVF